MNLTISPTVKVRLKSDLTQYHPGLTSGREGYTIGLFGQCSRLSKNYIGVWFPGIRIVDVNLAALEMIPEQRHVRRVEEKRKAYRQVLKWLGL